MPIVFSKPRYVPNYKGVPFRSKPIPKGFIYKAEVAVPTIVVTMDEEVISGPMPIYLPWIIVDPTSVGYYAW
jgi:hypothetical protein